MKSDHRQPYLNIWHTSFDLSMPKCKKVEWNVFFFVIRGEKGGGGREWTHSSEWEKETNSQETRLLFLPTLRKNKKNKKIKKLRVLLCCAFNKEFDEDRIFISCAHFAAPIIRHGHQPPVTKSGEFWKGKSVRYLNAMLNNVIKINRSFDIICNSLHIVVLWLVTH